MKAGMPKNGAKRRTDTASALVPAPPQAVYSALTEAAALSTWLPPKGMTGEVHELDPRPGGRFRMTLRYSETEGAPGKSTDSTDVVDAAFADLVPAELVVWSVRFDSDDPAFAGVMEMSWLLERAAEGTQVTIVAKDVPPGISAADHAAGLRSSLQNLATYFSAGQTP